MFISNETLVSTYFANNLETSSMDVGKDILRSFLLTKELLKRYGKKLIEFDIYIQALKKHSPETYEIILLLKKLNKLTIKNVSQIITLVKKKSGVIKNEFDIKCDANSQSLLGDFITSQFKTVEIHSEANPKIGIDIQGEGYRYKRDLDKDLNILMDNNF